MEVGKSGGWLNLGTNILGERLKVVSKIRNMQTFSVTGQRINISGFEGLMIYPNYSLL